MRALVPLLVLAFSTSAAGEERMFGLTRNGEPIVCADVNGTAAKTDDMVGVWILGFWSGLNAANHALVGDNSSASGVIGEVKLYCAGHPSLGIAQAAFDTYAAMKKTERR
jgi:hypothetical protein